MNERETSVSEVLTAQNQLKAAIEGLPDDLRQSVNMEQIEEVLDDELLAVTTDDEPEP